MRFNLFASAAVGARARAAEDATLRTGGNGAVTSRSEAVPAGEVVIVAAGLSVSRVAPGVIDYDAAFIDALPAAALCYSRAGREEYKLDRSRSLHII
jgi:hypothetical protein